MPTFDLILLAIIGLFALFGLWFGFIHTLGSLAGTVLGAYLASRYYEPMANWLYGVTGWELNSTRVLMFVLAFIIINRLVGLVFWLVDKILSIITRLPFVRSINKLAGLLLGAIEGGLTIGLIIYFAERFPFSEFISGYIANSVVAAQTEQMASVLLPLLPEGLRLLQSAVTQVEAVVR